MIYPADFIDAHQRHWQDAELLFNEGRWANADQLYGFSAECGLKAVMKALGMSVEPDGKPTDEEHRKHVRELWPIFKSFVSGRNGSQYLNQLPNGDPFNNWSHHNRYARGCHFQEADVEPHRKAACTVYQMIQRAKQDGQL